MRTALARQPLLFVLLVLGACGGETGSSADVAGGDALLAPHDDTLEAEDALEAHDAEGPEIDAQSVGDSITPPDDVSTGDDAPAAEVTPEDVTPEDVTPEDATPEDVTPEDVTPEDDAAPEEDADASGGDDTAAPDVSAPTGPALVWLDPPGGLVAAGGQVSVSWHSEGASSCVASLDEVPAGSGAEGSVSVTVTAVHHVVVRCEPQGAGAIAVATFAAQCSGAKTVLRLTAFGDNAMDQNNVAIPNDGTCIDVVYDAVTSGLGPTLAARIRTVGGSLSLFHGGDNGLDFAGLTSVGNLLPDYQNGAFTPLSVPLEDEYLCFPSLTTAGPNTVLLHGGRAAFPKLQGTGVYVSGSVNTLELAAGAVLGSFTYRGSTLDVAPRFVHGPLGGISGDVIIRDNPALPPAEVQALLDQLGPVGGATLVCGNLDGPACEE